MCFFDRSEKRALGSPVRALKQKAHAMRELGFMGGTFNPPHNLHLLVAQLAHEQFDLEKVLFTPSGQPPHKPGKVLLPKDVRLELTEDAIFGIPHFEACRLEVDRPGVTWSIDTLYELKRLYGDGVRLNFICGDDNVATFRDYERRAEILGLCRLLVCPRKRKGNAANKRMWRKMLPEADMEFIDCPLFPFSSTLVRDWIKEGRSIRHIVPERVFAKLESRGYFRDRPDLA